jgi:hypothetical protein
MPQGAHEGYVALTTNYEFLQCLPSDWLGLRPRSDA